VGALAIELQKEIDSLEYPPTHTYSIEGLVPTGVLAKRFQALKRAAPNFFTKAGRFLDVGCNKGFFSLYGSQFFDEVIGIDNDQSSIDLCNKIRPPNVQFVRTGFRDFTPVLQFDRVLFGNVHHYIFKECSGWDWLYKLAAISRGRAQVLIEGPVDMKCTDMQKAIPRELQNSFNEKEFMKIMNRFFDLKVKTPTVSYTPDRYIMLFERVPSEIENRIDLNSLPVVHLLRDSSGYNLRIFRTIDNLICKIYPTFPPKRSEWMSRDYFLSQLNMARLLPISNGIAGVVYSSGELVGWIEKEFKGLPCRLHQRNEAEIFKAHCQMQILLSRLGWLDFDPSPINFMETERGLCYFDKNSIHPIAALSQATFDRLKEWYFTVMRGSYTFGEKVLSLISDGIESRNSRRIEESYVRLLALDLFPSSSKRYSRTVHKAANRTISVMFRRWKRLFTSARAKLASKSNCVRHL
jgi:SAM-dependent methyltransferase